MFREARTLLKKYLNKLKFRYASSENLDHALNEGMRQICKTLEMPRITFYWARHSFANIARNQCRMTEDDVAESLNHIDGGHKTTDIYIERDWSIIDDVQKAVLVLLHRIYQSQLKKRLPIDETIVNAVSLIQGVVLHPLIKNAGLMME